MGLMITVSIHQAENVVFSDINAMNADLMKNSSLSEIYSDFVSEPTFNGPFALQHGTLQIANNGDGYFEGYDDISMTWGCLGTHECIIISKYLESGKIVFYEEIEGNDNHFYIIEPGMVSKKSLSDIRF